MAGCFFKKKTMCYLKLRKADCMLIIITIYNLQHIHPAANFSTEIDSCPLPAVFLKIKLPWLLNTDI